jgi:hypothetical protein
MINPLSKRLPIFLLPILYLSYQPVRIIVLSLNWVYPIVAKAGWLQSQGIKGEAVITYRNPLITKGLALSGFPNG